MKKLGLCYFIRDKVELDWFITDYQVIVEALNDAYHILDSGENLILYYYNDVDYSEKRTIGWNREKNHNSDEYFSKRFEVIDYRLEIRKKKLEMLDKL